MDGRRNAWKSVAVWASATLAGIAVCWWGIRPVLDAVVPDRLVAFPAATSTSPVPGVPTRAADPATSAPPSASVSASPFPSRPVRSPGHSATPSAAPSPTPSIVDGWTTLPDGGYVRTFDLVGGTVTVHAGAGTMDLVSATPKPSFVMAVAPTTPDRVHVTFSALLLRSSTLDARWTGGAPTAKVTEIP